MARKPISYWEKRQTQLMKRLEKKTEPTINEITNVYRQATDNINREIVRIYNNYGKDSGLTRQALDQLLNTRETETHYKNLLTVIQNNITDEDLKKKLLAKYTAPAYNYRISRYQALQEDIDMELKKAADKEIELMRLRYVDTIKSSYYRNIFDIQKGLNLSFRFNTIDDKTINLLLNEKWTNKANFSMRIWKNNEKLGEYLKTQLSAASLSGKSIQKISSDLAHYMNVGTIQATTLVRTEVNHFANEAEMLAYEELDIEEYRFIATLDKVTCVHCAKLDKCKFKVKEKKVGFNYPPIHPNDRCTTIPVFDDQEIDSLKRKARDPETNQNYILDKSLSYNDWYNQYVLKNNQNDSIMVPSFKKNYNKEIRQYTENQINIISKEMDKKANKYLDNKSKWSRKTVVDDIDGGYKDWNCDIRVTSKTSPSIILHEHIHAHSISYETPSIYTDNANIEEATVQLMTQEICNKENIAVTPSRYDELVDNLRTINHKLEVEKEDFEFAKSLINTKVKKRVDLLLNKLSENIELDMQERFDIQQLIETLRGSDIIGSK